MKQPKLRELKPGDSFTGFYLVSSKRIKQTRENTFYLDLDLQDSSGFLNAKLWDNFERYRDEFERGEVVKIEGIVEQYKDQLQIRIKRLRKSRPEDLVNLRELMSASKEDPERMLSELREILSGVKNPALRELIGRFFADPAFLEKLQRASAARNIHHSYLGGLLEHIWHMVKIAHLLVREVYPQLNYDLMLVGSFLHDLGKIEELEFKPGTSFTREGYLEGHLILGLKLLEQKLSELPSFPEELKIQLAHIILSHHGEYEWGSPVLPATPEAMLIHHIDNLDAKLAMVIEAIESDLNQAEEFTGYHPVLKRHFYKGGLKPRGEDQE